MDVDELLSAARKKVKNPDSIIDPYDLSFVSLNYLIYREESTQIFDIGVESCFK